MIEMIVGQQRAANLVPPCTADKPKVQFADHPQGRTARARLGVRLARDSGGSPIATQAAEANVLVYPSPKRGALTFDLSGLP
jgi:hypothetical protein